MLDQLRQIAIFARTVEHGSFRGAAQALRLSPSVVSHHISQLEQSLSTALLYRSTRRLALTDDGRRLMDAARDMLAAAEAGLQAVSDHSETPSGEIRVTAPAVLAQSDLPERIAAFAAAYPLVSLVLDFADQRRDLIRDGFDVAIRMGWLEDSQLISRRLNATERKLVCAPDLLRGKDEPQSPADLKAWPWLELTQVGAGLSFRHKNGQRQEIRPDARIGVNDANAMAKLCESGAGLAVLPSFLIDKALAGGRLCALLPDWKPAEIGVYAVWPQNAPRRGLVGRFVDSLIGRTGSAPD